MLLTLVPFIRKPLFKHHRSLVSVWYPIVHWILNKETKLESYINTDQAEYEHSALHTNFLSETFLKENIYFSLYFFVSVLVVK